MMKVYELCARYLQVYDEDVIGSWTMNEYKAKLKGAHLREIDQLENLSKGAMMNAIAANKKGTTAKKLFDAQKARRELEKGSLQYTRQEVKQPLDKTRYNKMKKAMSSYQMPV
ncbi:hypothetical protein [Jeotgalibacillus proteolyticus]|uniref:Uncharacterized protein n=1 Tax=Jeotgalibacillus proteolyticus TaxID=2082395 RepID=A0A2S5GAU1_9BACL|nr:hypothetical protein [Jeotgalibacillus proteolyticus]PPA70034.1 hypothetical protein C4B60_10585 [Jeotgalibacillus proteolyticus]